MYHTLEWYISLRDVGLLWQALSGVSIFWRELPKRKYRGGVCAAFWIAGAVILYLSRRYDLLWLRNGTNVYFVYMLSVAVVLSACRVSFCTAWMIGSAGFLAQQISGNLELAFRTLPVISRATDYSFRIVFLDVLFYGGTYAALRAIFRNNGYREDRDMSDLQKNMFSLLSTMFSLGFYTINQYLRGWQNFSVVELATNALYISMGGIFLLITQYGLNRQQRMNAEFHTMQALLHAQENQWQNSRELTELVNEKYHDLKKLIRSFRGSVEPQYLDALSDAVEAYDDNVKTGSQVADVVLTEGRELCRKHAIQFTCYVNGGDFRFMEDMDFYSLLKNALDNAIEAVEALPPDRDRFISMTARREGKLAVLHIENPCGDVLFSDDLPLTRRDTDFHGFGIKSMLNVAKKYGGMLTCSEKNGVFFLDAVLAPED